MFLNLYNIYIRKTLNINNSELPNHKKNQRKNFIKYKFNFKNQKVTFKFYIKKLKFYAFNYKIIDIFSRKILKLY